jgi:hypothetical protein
MATVIACAGSARAQRPATFGLGAEAMLAGPSGAAVVYDAGPYHIDGIVRFSSVDTAAFFGSDLFHLAGRFFYVLHQRNSADFSVGGGVGVTHDDNDPGEDDTAVFIEGGAQLRAFISENVALSSTVGLAIIVDDDPGGADRDGVVLGGQLTGALGIVYFFN